MSIWRRRRKILVPAFSPKIVENFVDIFSEQSEKLSKRLAEYSNTGSFSIWPFVSTYTLDSVCGTYNTYIKGFSIPVFIYNLEWYTSKTKLINFEVSNSWVRFSAKRGKSTTINNVFIYKYTRCQVQDERG